jgi:FOG: EAL domain
MLESEAKTRALPPEEMGVLVRKDRTRDDVLLQFLQLTTKLFHMPSGYISVLDDKMRNVMVSHQIAMTPKPRQFTFCQYVVDTQKPVIVPDTLQDPRFCDHAMVVGPPGLRFYAGIPLTFQNGCTLGTYCVVDTVPRELTSEELASLMFIADLVSRFIESWLAVALTDLNSGLPNMHQLINDLQDDSSTEKSTEHTLIVIECISLTQSDDIARVMGTKRLNTLVRDISMALMRVLTLEASEKLYTLSAGRFALYSKPLTLCDRRRREQQLMALQAHLSDAVTIDLKIYVGETAITLPVCSAQESLRQAESALYEARHNRLHWGIYNQDDDCRRNEDFYLLNDLTEAIRKDKGLYLVWQPKVSLPEGKPVALEALIRWNHPERGNMPPGCFLPLIENTSLMMELTDWVIDHAIEQLSVWQGKGILLPASINISVLDLKREDFTYRLRNKMAQSGLDNGMLGIECLETEKLLASSLVLEELRLLRHNGFGVSLDDFGAGYSNLNYLLRIPLDTIKLDKSLIDDLPQEPSQRVIVRNIIRMLKELGYRVLAEGVEDEETARIISAYECDEAQGYYFSRPKTAEELEVWLEISR